MGLGMVDIRSACRAGIVAAALFVSAQAPAQYIGDAPPPLPSEPVGAENSSDALSRNVRILAQSPRNYKALVGAGRAALGTGDPEAAVGFFGRASDVLPAAAAPHAGNGAALVAMGEAAKALPEFAEAEKLGAPLSSFAADRGLAHDLLGQQAAAQADYRLALIGRDGAEARRRLALSLAISGDSVAAMAALTPLLRNSDVATNRVRAFVLALGGNPAAADRALDLSVPGMSRQLDPFFRRLPGLTAAQKAAAVHLGIFPDIGQGPALASAGPPYFPAPGSGLATTSSPLSTYRMSTEPVSGDRLAGIDALLRDDVLPPSPGVPPADPATVLPSYQVASRALVPTPPAAPRRYWVQLASGPNEAALADQYQQIAAKDPVTFQPLHPFVSQVGGRSKLLVGPFKNGEDSQTFVENIGEARIEGFGWVSAAGQVVRRLGSQ